MHDKRMRFLLFLSTQATNQNNFDILLPLEIRMHELSTGLAYQNMIGRLEDSNTIVTTFVGNFC